MFFSVFYLTFLFSFDLILKFIEHSLDIQIKKLAKSSV